jgi:hypothetical protein
MPVVVLRAKGFEEGWGRLFCGYPLPTPDVVTIRCRTSVKEAMRWWLVLLPIAALAAPPTREPQFHIERRAVPGGAELLTVFGRIPDVRNESEDRDVPLLAVLRDTLGDQDPDNDRLRYVWVLTSSSPTVLQRVASAVPFFYWRAGLGKDADRTPSPVANLSTPRGHVWTTLAASIAQVMALDPRGAIVRSSTRSYRNNSRDHRQLHLLEGLAVLSQLENVPDLETHISEPELLEMQARLALAAQPFGGLVGNSKLPEAYIKQRTRTMEERGHNWELLRQRAEANGLYFEPFGLNGSATQALLWVAKEDLGSPHAFDSQFLDISDPFRDSRLKNWTGYTEKRDDQELIPLGLYSLDHPKVPLLLVDFRNTRAPRRREMIRHAAVDVLSGVIGYSRWGNWPYFAGSWTWNFIRTRHGAASDRTARIRAYSQVRQWLALDSLLDPELRSELLKRLQSLGVNPLEDNVFDEAEFAERQYAALLEYADEPTGLAARLDRDRSSEILSYEHNLGVRTAIRVAHVASLGLYSHHEKDAVLLETRVSEQRRAASGRILIRENAAP